MRWMGLFAIALCSAFLASPASAQKLPSAYDGYRDGFVYNGKQNMPFKLYGVAIQWNLDCLKGKAAQCMRLAKAFETGLGDLEADLRVTVGYYMLACDKGDGEGCAQASKMLREGSAGFTNAQLAEEKAERGCTVLKNQSACAGKAVGLASRGDGAGAAALVESSCAAGADDGCRIKANTLFYVKQDAASRTEALGMFEPACKARRAWGCMGLTDAYLKGLGVARDRAKAFEYARIGCTQSEGDKLRLCTLHGVSLTDSTDKATLNRGEKILDAACTAGDGVACNHIGRLGMDDRAGATTTKGEALYYLRRGCDLNYAQACTALANAYWDGVKVDADLAIAYALEAKGCRLGDPDGCEHAERFLAKDAGLKARIPSIDPTLPVADQLRLAKAAVERGDRIAGVKAVVRLMQEENEDAEWLLGGWMYYGLPGVFGTERKSDGLILFENAARVGHVEAAVFMGMAYWYGDGVAEDRAKGENYMAIAADRGSQMARAIYRSMKAEPIRQENARRAQEMAEWAAKREAEWQSGWNHWTPSWTAPSTTYNPVSTGPSVSQILDQSSFNQMISYYSGGTSVCPSYNRYC